MINSCLLIIIIIRCISNNISFRLLFSIEYWRLRNKSCFHTTMAANDNNWRGVPLSEIRGSQSPWGVPEFPLVIPSHKHAVLYHIPSNGSLPSDRPPVPQKGQDKWDQEHVRMPCSSHSLYPVVDETTGEKILKSRWGLIEDALSKPIKNVKELTNAILSYNTKFKSVWKFVALNKYFDEYLEEDETNYFFDVTLPAIAKLALSLPKLIQAPIPLLKQHRNRSVSLSQQQISCILANSFFCTFPRRNASKKDSEYSSYSYINFSKLYNCYKVDDVYEKLKCLCHYFRRVTNQVPTGAVTFSRRSVPPRRCPDWARSERALAAVPVHVDSETLIEDLHGLIQVDFANKFLGGGVLERGCVQEEIRFVICPELMAVMLVAEEMRPNEAVLVIGVERYSEYSGYAHTFEWAGEHLDHTPRDSSLRRRCAVLAMDAVRYSRAADQLREEMFSRELTKAWVGFSWFSEEEDAGVCGGGGAVRLQYPGAATGNWGCGAFRGCPRLKWLLQLAAAAQAARPLAYTTYHDPALRDDLVQAYDMLAANNVTVGQLYSYLLDYSELKPSKIDVYAYLRKVILGIEDPASEDNGNKRKMKKLLKSQLLTSSQHSSSNSQHTQPTLINEFTNFSPDLFSDTELPTGDTLADATTDRTDRQADTTNLIKLTDSGDVEMTDESKMAEDHEMAADDEKHDKVALNEKTPNKTLSLFDEMEKFDKDNSNLNLSVPNTSLLIAKGDTQGTKDDIKINLNITEETKKKFSRKITDYFSKKST